MLGVLLVDGAYLVDGEICVRQQRSREESAAPGGFSEGRTDDPDRDSRSSRPLGECRPDVQLAEDKRGGPKRSDDCIGISRCVEGQVVREV